MKQRVSFQQACFILAKHRQLSNFEHIAAERFCSIPPQCLQEWEKTDPLITQKVCQEVGSCAAKAMEYRPKMRPDFKRIARRMQQFKNEVDRLAGVARRDPKRPHADVMRP
eukprot:2103319-Amphidinium_carterae.2